MDVNDEGTEAAAAMALIMKMIALEATVSVVRANHPFIFIIRDDDTGNILVLGRVSDPMGR